LTAIALSSSPPATRSIQGRQGLPLSRVGGEQSTSNRREDEEQLFEKSLREQGQLANEDCDELPAGSTHQVQTNDKGEPTIERKRFSAV
jgi:hypothetical protein